MVTRIRQLLEDKQLTPTQFADLIGVGRPVVSHILSERNKPSLEVVQHIIAAFPEIALPWLLSGAGPMLAESAPTPPSVSGEASPPAVAPTTPAAAPTPTPEPLPARPASPVSSPGTVPPVLPANLPAVAPAVVPFPAPRPFRVARFGPAAVSAPAAATPAGLAESPVTPAAPVRPATAAPAPAQQAAGPPPFPVEAGKAIRRIVIFYQDGSFTDYQPEA